MSGLIIAATSDDTSLPIYEPDAIINSGSLFCFDFSNPACWDPAATVANNAIINNLVATGVPAVIKDPTGALIFVTGSVTPKGFQKTAADFTHYIQLSAGADYLQSNLTDDYLFVTWTIKPGSDPGASNNLILAKQAGAALGGPGLFLNAQGGYAGAGRMDSKFSINNTTNTDLTDGAAYAIGAAPGLHQMGFARIGTSEYLIRDGVIIASGVIPNNPGTGAPWVYNADSAPFTFMCNPNSTGTATAGLIGSRTWAEDLTISAAAAGVSTATQMASQVLSDYNAVLASGRFT